MIELKHVSKTFDSDSGGVDALKDVSLTIEDGDIYGIIGMSGAGKSTLVRCINLLEKPTAGEVVVDGQRLDTMTPAQLRAARREITMIFQRFNLLMQRTCLQNVCFPMELSGVKKADGVRRAKELLELVGLPDKAQAYPAQLSGGQQQRVAIARALATQPKVLLCDEATSALDPNTTHQILELIRDINQKLGITVVVITHNTEVLAYDGEKVYTCPIKARNLSGRTGRGDTTFAGYIAERQRGSVEEALNFCTALVSLKMETPGPFKGTREDVLAYMKEFY